MIEADHLPRDEVDRRLDAIEAEEEVRVVYAVESGSRAWGFASTDSDYDVRFLYVHRPAWYVRIDRQRDVVERPIVDEMDLAGWDLRKALGLFLKSNPPLYEWLRSPLVYRETAGVAAGMRALAPSFYSARAGFHHYLHMAEGNYRAELRKETIRHKKYLYVLRPVLACRWIDAHATDPPMEFGRLVDAFLPDGPVRAELDGLLRAKRAGAEADAGSPLPRVQAFIEAELAALADRADAQPKPRRSVDPLNAFLVRSLREAWPDDPFWRGEP